MSAATESRSRVLFTAALAGAVALSGSVFSPDASAGGPVPPPGSLKGLPPRLPDLGGIVKDRDWAVVLGKALFFDQQLGSDGQACASCHYSAGADSRIRNQLHPGGEDANPEDPSAIVFGGIDRSTFPPTQTGLLPSGRLAGPNVTLGPDDFPLYQLADPDDRTSPVLFETNDVVSSQGSFGDTFLSLAAAPASDDVCADAADFVFHVGDKRVRKVAGRNTPTTINAVYNTRNFWDGRANAVFNGVSVFGRRDVSADPAARVIVTKGNGAVAFMTLDIPNASLASQADGPPRSSTEVACAGRSFADIGRKMLARQPLALQAIHAEDSVFGAPSAVGDIRAPGGHGLALTYRDLIELAFDDKLWADNKGIRINPQGHLARDPRGYLQREMNFSLFFGLSILLYESTLVSDDAPIDRLFGCAGAQCDDPAPPDPSAMTPDELAGMEIFNGKGRCARCHSGPLMTRAAYVEVPGFPPPTEVVNRMLLGDGGIGLYDVGFYNTGVTPAGADPGIGGTDPYGNPLSYTRQLVNRLRTGKATVDPFQIDPCGFSAPFDPTNCRSLPSSPAELQNIRVAVDGAFKTPTLRNVGLTAPYFHDGSAATLDQVIEVYNRGGNWRGTADDNTTGTGPLGDGVLGPSGARGSNLDPGIRPLHLTPTEKAQLKAFMLALTDDRVSCRRAPFDGPELSLPNGHRSTDALPADGKLDAEHMIVPATGQYGLPPGDCLPNTGDLFDIAPP